MAYYPFAPENSAIYRLNNGAVTAVFNDPLDPDFVGYLTEVTGLDSAEVRESAEDMVQADGGIHGNFYYGRRPIILNGKIVNFGGTDVRRVRMDKIMRASDAMRGDATLSWKPYARKENLVFNPIMGIDTTGYSGQSGGTTIVKDTVSMPGGYASGMLWSGTVAATAQGIYIGRGSTAVSGFPVIPGRPYAAQQTFRIDSITSGAITAIRYYVYWYKSDGSASTITPNVILQQVNSPAVGTTYVMSGTAVAPSDAAYARLRPYTVTTNPTTFSIKASGFSLVNGTTPYYVDGTQTGMYWQGADHASESGDYIDMYTTVRRQQSPRFTGGFNKDFQVALVSEYASLFSSQIRTYSGSSFVAVENRGSGSFYPIISLYGPTGAGPTVTNTITNKVLRFTSDLTLTSSEYITVDTFNHTATLSGSGRAGVANRYINFATTDWPAVESGQNSYNPSSGSNVVINMRDAWD